MISSSTPEGKGFWIGLAVSAALIVFLVYSWYAASRADNESREKNRKSLGDLAHFLPQTTTDFRRYVAVSITAGIVEEIIYRGFVLWYLSLFMPLWGAVNRSDPLSFCWSNPYPYERHPAAIGRAMRPQFAARCRFYASYC